jgi:hypothetical protein
MDPPSFMIAPETSTMNLLGHSHRTRHRSGLRSHLLTMTEISCMIIGSNPARADRGYCVTFRMNSSSAAPVSSSGAPRS